MPVLDSFSLQGKIALVTGAAGRHAPIFVQALAEAGATVYGADLNLPAMEQVASGFRQQGLDVIPLPVDLTDESSIHALRDAILQRSGRVDVLVNAAVGRSMWAWEDDAAKFAESMAVNATGLFMTTRAFGDVMAQQRRGSIVNIASMQGLIGPDRTLYEGMDWHGFIPDYFFHKAGMINFTRFVASYYGPQNVRCNALSPGGILSMAADDPFPKRYARRTLLGRMANPPELMGALVFLASEASSYMTGANLVLDGGYTAI